MLTDLGLFGLALIDLKRSDQVLSDLEESGLEQSDFHLSLAH